MRLTSSGAWTVYASLASIRSSNRPQPVGVQATAQDEPEVLGPDLHEIRSDVFQEREILGEPKNAVRIQPGQVGTHAPKDHTAPSSLRSAHDRAQYKLAGTPFGERSVNDD